MVKLVIRFAPVGIFGLVSSTLATTGFDALWGYAQLLVVLGRLYAAGGAGDQPAAGVLADPPQPVSAGADLPARERRVCLLYPQLGGEHSGQHGAGGEAEPSDRDTYSVSIPLGATVNMAGAAITITVLTLAAVHTLGIPVDLPTALLLSVVASLCACGASGVAGGSLLLIPLACNMFGIPNEIAMQVVAVGFIIGVLQDSCETALNSSTDVLFTAAACQAEDARLAKNALRS